MNSDCEAVLVNHL